VIGFKP